MPEGFVIERVAGPPEIRFPMFACFDDRGRLYVAESSGLDLYAEVERLTRNCRVSVLEDRDSDGRYEHSHVYADKLVFPMGLAWRDGRLYVPDVTELVALTDRDGDDVAETRTVLLGGFGHTDNGALHGQIFGPDGLLYSTMGSPDGYRITQADGTVIQSHTGMLLRNRADGSHPEVLARGFTNLIEVEFLPTGEIVGSNTWIQHPVGGLRDSLVHLVEGGVYGYWEELEGDTPLLVTGPRLPPLTVMPATACSGVTLGRGRQFPAEMRGNLFVAQFNTRGVTRHVLARSGSTFRSQDLDFLTTDDPDFHPADVLEDADGSLLVLDTGSWYVQHCPTGSIRVSPAQGAIYRIRYGPIRPPEDPRGLSIDWPAAPEADLTGCAGTEGVAGAESSKPQRDGTRLGNSAGASKTQPQPRSPPTVINSYAADLTPWLSDPRHVVRQRAAAALTLRGREAIAPLADLLRGPAEATAKQHAVWTLVAIDDPRAVAPLAEVLAGHDADLAALTARAIARRGEKGVAPQLHALLEHETLHVRMAAAEALIHCGSAESVPKLFAALTRSPDRFLQHILTVALHRWADRQALETALEHSHPQVQRAALLLLDQPPHACLGPAAVVSRASAADGDLRAAARAILRRHPEWGVHAVELVRQGIAKAEATAEEESALREFILAFQTDAAVQAAVAGVLNSAASDLPSRRRILLLETMARCEMPELPAAWKTAIANAVPHADPAVREQAVRTLGTLQIAALDDTLSQIAGDAHVPKSLRVEALRAVIRRRPALSGPTLDVLLGRLDEQQAPIERLAAGEVLAQARLDAAGLRRLIAAVQEDPVISPTVVLDVFERSLAHDTAPQVIDYLRACLERGWIVPPKQVDLVLAALPANEQATARQSLHDAQPSTDIAQQAARLAEYEALLGGGDAARGRSLFFGKATCSTCHAVRQEGGTIGPDLTTIGAIRSGRDLIESLVLPSATIAQKYETYNIITAEGRVIQGILARQSKETLVVYDAAGAELRLRADQIDELHVSRRSLMPDGLLHVLSRDEIRDLLAYLSSLK